ncbi:DUF5592 family protein [Lysinibacillus sp. BF-4]|uniref:DUF5592 family protein n=1 Tax=Lysinibacillus sp. BF-4 TaxID=1473546 RepID=UPI000B2195E2|nr:DUF5592 family protein [Lysinibacillus sp. BF-4]
MNRFEIPKEIKTKPKLLGLEIKEMAILVLLIILIMTFFKDMVHGLFVIPYFIVAVGFLFYMIAPSTHNPQKKNFHALYLFFKRDKSCYHAIERHTIANEEVMAQVREQNVLLFGKDKIEKGYQVTNETSDKLKEQHNPTVAVKDMPSTQASIVKKESVITESIVETEVMHSAEIKVAEAPTNDSDTMNETESVKEVQSHSITEVAQSPSVDEIELTETKGRDQVLEAKKARVKATPNNVQAIEDAEEIAVPTMLEKQQPTLSKAKVAWFKKLWPRKGEKAQPIKKAETGGGFVLKLFTHKRVNKNLVPALRSFGMQQYDEALKYFEQIDFQKLEITDQDMMLLSYLFTGQAARAIELSPDFAETVVNYYKTTNNIEVLRQLATKVQSRVLDFEVAVDNGDYWKVIELKEFVLMKADRHQAIVQAYVALDNLHKARQYADEVGDRTLIEYVKNIVQADKETISEPLLPKENASPLLKTNLFTRNENGDYSFI